EQNLAGIRLVEALDEREDCGLPRARGADERGHPARRDGEADAMVDFGQFQPVPEPHLSNATDAGGTGTALAAWPAVGGPGGPGVAAGPGRGRLAGGPAGSTGSRSAS